MTGLLLILVIVGIAFAAVYFLYPNLLVALLIAALRKWGRLSPKTVTVGDITWPYLEGGPPDGEVVVMVHGFGGDKNNWSLYARYFTKRFRVIVPDLPGFGDNVRNPEWDYGMAKQAERLHDFLTQLGVDKCHIAGNSMGGFIAIYYALDYAEDLATLTLIDSAGVKSRNKSELEIAISEKRNLLVANTLEEFDALLKFIAHKPIPTPRIVKVAMLQIQQRHHDFLDKIFWELTEEATEKTVTDRLGEISVPTLIVWGRHDRVLDVSCTEAMATSIPNNKVVIFEDAGHIPMVEKSRETAGHQVQLITAQ